MSNHNLTVSWKLIDSNKVIVFSYRVGLYKQFFFVEPYSLIYHIANNSVDAFIADIGKSRPDTDYLISLIHSHHLRKSFIYRLLSQKSPHPISLPSRSSNWGGLRSS